MKRLIAIAAVMVPLISNAAGPYGIRRDNGLHSEQAFNFRITVGPLLDAEWWAAAAVSCRLRQEDWLRAVEISIDYQAAIAARSIWDGSAGFIDRNLQTFASTQRNFRDSAAHTAPATCGVLRSSGMLEQLDHMAATLPRPSTDGLQSSLSQSNLGG